MMNMRTILARVAAALICGTASARTGNVTVDETTKVVVYPSGFVASNNLVTTTNATYTYTVAKAAVSIGTNQIGAGLLWDGTNLTSTGAVATVAWGDVTGIPALQTGSLTLTNVAAGAYVASIDGATGTVTGIVRSNTLGTAAYTAATNYATAAQGARADLALTNASAFDASGSAAAVSNALAAGAAAGAAYTGTVASVSVNGTNYQPNGAGLVDLGTIAGVGAGDNLGNHTATTNLLLAGNQITGVDKIVLQGTTEISGSGAPFGITQPSDLGLSLRAGSSPRDVVFYGALVDFGGAAISNAEYYGNGAGITNVTDSVARAWGDHATNGYLTAETDPVWSGVSNTVTANAANGNAAYGWGDHGTNGYLTTESDPTALHRTVDNPDTFITVTNSFTVMTTSPPSDGELIQLITGGLSAYGAGLYLNGTGFNPDPGYATLYSGTNAESRVVIRQGGYPGNLIASFGVGGLDMQNLAVSNAAYYGNGAGLTNIPGAAIASALWLTNNQPNVTLPLLTATSNLYVQGNLLVTNTIETDASTFVLDGRGSSAIKSQLTIMNTREGALVSGQDWPNEVHLTLQAGATNDHRAYIEWKNYAGSFAWSMGRNAQNCFILADQVDAMHTLFIEPKSVSGNAYFNSQGTGKIILNSQYGSVTNAGTGGLYLYNGVSNILFKVDSSSMTLNTNAIVNGTLTTSTSGGTNYLHVHDTRSTTGDSAGILLGTSTDWTFGKTLIAHVETGANGIGDCVVAVRSATDSASAALSDERMRITSAGNVGIGTNAPSAKLHINGSVLVETNLTVNGVYYGNGAGLTNIPAASVTGAPWLTAEADTNALAQLSAHTGDTSAAHAASAISTTNAGLADAQTAINYLLTNAPAAGTETQTVSVTATTNAAGVATVSTNGLNYVLNIGTNLTGVGGGTHIANEVMAYMNGNLNCAGGFVSVPYTRESNDVDGVLSVSNFVFGTGWINIEGSGVFADTAAGTGFFLYLNNAAYQYMHYGVANNVASSRPYKLRFYNASATNIWNVRAFSASILWSTNALNSAYTNETWVHAWREL